MSSLPSWQFCQLVKSAADNIHKLPQGPAEILRTADIFQGLDEDQRRGKIVAARKPHIAYYIGREFKLIPNVLNSSELSKALREQSIDYVFFSRYEASWYRQFENLLNSKQHHEGLIPIVSLDNPPCVLYQVAR